MAIVKDFPPPEEGVQGWLCVAGCFLALFATFEFLNARFQTTYEQTVLRQYSSSDISWIFAVQLCLMWVLGPLYGCILDTYGSAPVLYPCSLLCVFSLCMTSLAKEYHQIFLAQGLGFGVDVGGVFTTSIVCVGQWCHFPIILNRVIDSMRFFGAVRYTVLFVGVPLAVSCIMVGAGLPRRKWNSKLPWFNVTLFKQKQFALYAFGSFLVMWRLWGPLDYPSRMAQEKMFSPTLALYLISIIRFFTLTDRSKGEHMAEFTNLDNARWALLTIIERLIQIRSLWASRNTYSSFLKDTTNTYPSVETILDHLTLEIFRLDQWILALNIYLSHGVPVSQVCDAYVLGLCGFFLKFRITMDHASINSHDFPYIDFSHITSLGETLLHGYGKLPAKVSCAPGEEDRGASEEARCPLHGLFIDENRSESRLDAEMSDNGSSDQQKLFLVLAVFCSLCVASVYSSDPDTRRKAQDTVLSTCRCKAGWDMNLTNYIARLLSPVTNSSTYEIPFDHDALLEYEKLLSHETHVLLAQLRLLR
ncbi:putative transporter MCH4 [Talaromyces islandicus]|uniref:Putative transporter MCH4 n=1 Tax=Talaromyces islandicus TaxID=28573 RepID=A0A0U1MA72_TALIS|nr:putative transporter MCH4 [Talaromyces islandicus]